MFKNAEQRNGTKFKKNKYKRSLAYRNETKHTRIKNKIENTEIKW